jgi:hypothetical protein
MLFLLWVCAASSLLLKYTSNWSSKCSPRERRIDETTEVTPTTKRRNFKHYITICYRAPEPTVTTQRIIILNWVQEGEQPKAFVIFSFLVTRKEQGHNSVLVSYCHLYQLPNFVAFLLWNILQSSMEQRQIQWLFEVVHVQTQLKDAKTPSMFLSKYSCSN